MHGRKPGMAKRLTRAAKGRIDVALMEGTHTEASGKQRMTEQDLEGQIVGHIKNTPGIVLAHFSPMHVDRLVTFFPATKRTNHVFVIDHYTAWVMYLICHQCGIPDPRRDERIKVYYPQAFLKTYHSEDQQRRSSKSSIAIVSRWKRLWPPRSRFVIVFRPTMLGKTSAVSCPKGRAASTRTRPGYLEQPIRLILSRGHLCAANNRQGTQSGHMFSQGHGGVPQRDDPKMVIPLHTSNPESFPEARPKVRTLMTESRMK